LGHLVKLAEIDGQPVSSGFVSLAHELGLVVHPWTFRVEQLIPGFENLTEMVQWCVEELKIDGLFTDFPDLARRGLRP
jgi:glycerophosphoryl diester phosphodiesterase